MNSITRESTARKPEAKGLKLAPQRPAIIEALIKKRDSHPGVRSVYEEAKERKKDLSLSTAYATPNEFPRPGIIKTLQFDSMENRYEGNPEEHLNLICKHRGEVLDCKIFPVADRHISFSCYGSDH